MKVKTSLLILLIIAMITLSGCDIKKTATKIANESIEICVDDTIEAAAAEFRKYGDILTDKRFNGCYDDYGDYFNFVADNMERYLNAKKISMLDAMEAAVKAGETGNPDLLYDVFADNIKDEALYAACKEYVNAFPDKPHTVEYRQGGGGSKVRDNMVEEHGSCTFTVITEDETYYGMIYMHMRNDIEPEKTGIIRLWFVTDDANSDSLYQYPESGLFIAP